MNDNDHRLARVLLSLLLVIVLRTVLEAAAPSPPTNLTVAVDGMTVTLTWSKSSVGDNPTSFLIEAGTFPGGTNVFAGDVGNTTALVTSAPAGTYFVRVRAVNADGISASSNEVTVVVGAAAACVPLSPPTTLAPTVSGTNITIAWTAVSSATSYYLEAGSAAGLANLFAGDVGNVTSIGAVAGPGTYYVRLRSRNACGLSAPTTEIVITVGTGGGGTSGGGGTGGGSGTGGTGGESLVGTLTDPAGDAGSGNPDLIAAVLAVNGGALDITVQFAAGTFNRTPRTAGSGGTIVRVALDIDNNPATGTRGSDFNCIADNGIMGTEFTIVFGPGEDGAVRGRVVRHVGPACNDVVVVGYTEPGSVTTDAASARVVVPLALLGNDDGRFAYKVLALKALGTGLTMAVLDRMTNTGVPPGVVPNP